MENLFDKYIKAYEGMLWPVAVTDKRGKVIYKNEYAVKTKLFRKGSSLCRMFKNKDEFFEIVTRGDSGIIECRSSLGITHAIIICEDECVTVFFIVNAMLIKTLQNENYLASNSLAHGTNERIIKTYRDMCDKLNIVKDEKANEILKYNSLRFFRACGNYELYVTALMHSAFTYKDELTNITEICNIIGSHFAKQISPYGYRFNCDVKDNLLTTRTKSRVFVPVFFETALLALKMSDTRTCQATATNLNNNIRIEYFFTSTCMDQAVISYAAELDFLRVITETMKWKYSGICDLGNNNYMISFSLPMTFDSTKLECEPLYIIERRRKKYIEYADSVISVLFFE